MTDSLGEQWEKTFHNDTYEIGEVPKKFFTSLAASPFIQTLIKYSGIKPGETFLEAGCGSGKWSVVMATLGYKVTALDYSAKMLKNVKKLQVVAERYFGKLGIETVQDDLENLKIDKKFKAVFNEGVVEHWLNRDERLHVIEEMKKVTQKGGTTAIYVPNGANPFHSWWVLTRFHGYISAPKMIRYSVGKMKKDMQQVGLTDLYTDGFDAYASFNKWPTTRLLDYPIGYAEKHFPLPKTIRESLGTIIACLGKNPI